MTGGGQSIFAKSFMREMLNLWVWAIALHGRDTRPF